MVGYADPAAAFGGITMNGAMRSLVEDIRTESNHLYDLTLPPDKALGTVSEILASELRYCGFGDIRPEEVRECIVAERGRSCVKNIVSSYFGPRQPEDMSGSDLLDLHIRLTVGLDGYFESGKVRNGSYENSNDGSAVSVKFTCLDPGLGLSRLVSGYTSSAYDPLISSVILYGGLRALRPFDGDSRLFYTEVLRKSLCASGLWGFRYCILADVLSRHDDEIESALCGISSNKGMSRFIELMLICLQESLHDAVIRLVHSDMKNTLVGVEGATERAIIRLARTRSDFQMSEALYLGDCAPQAFRKRLNHLISIGIIEKTGRTRGSRYKLVDPFESVFLRYGGCRMHMGMVVGADPQRAEYIPSHRYEKLHQERWYRLPMEHSARMRSTARHGDTVFRIP